RHTRSDRDWSSDVCSSDLAVNEPPILGGLQKRPALSFAERHLGLRTATAESVSDSLLDAWGDEVERSFDVDALLAIARGAPELRSEERRVGKGGRCGERAG